VAKKYLPLYLLILGIFGQTDIAIILVDCSAKELKSNFYDKTSIFPSPGL
jgi:hypothetical protein